MIWVTADTRCGFRTAFQEWPHISQSKKYISDVAFVPTKDWHMYQRFNIQTSAASLLILKKFYHFPLYKQVPVSHVNLSHVKYVVSGGIEQLHLIQICTKTGLHCTQAETHTEYEGLPN